jgi:hypothetical protein
MSTIVKTFIGRHIDLSKVVSISDAYFIDNMGSGGFYVGFEIHCQLLDSPIKYERKFEYDEEDFSGHRPKPVTTSISSDLYFLIEDKDILAVQRLQKQINELVEQWKSVNEK